MINEIVVLIYLDRMIVVLKYGGFDVEIESVIFLDGEKYKDFLMLMKVYDKVIEIWMDRWCIFVVLGGGVIGDMCGYVVVFYFCGVNFI